MREGKENTCDMQIKGDTIQRKQEGHEELDGEGRGQQQTRRQQNKGNHTSMRMS